MSSYQEESKRSKEASYTERRAKALSGARVEYLTCPLCGRNRPLKMWGKQTTFEVKPNYDIIQIRYGGGRGVGFFLSEGEGTKIEDLQRAYPEVYENLKREVEKLYALLAK